MILIFIFKARTFELCVRVSLVSTLQHRAHAGVPPLPGWTADTAARVRSDPQALLQFTLGNRERNLPVPRLRAVAPTVLHRGARRQRRVTRHGSRWWRRLPSRSSLGILDAGAHYSLLAAFDRESRAILYLEVTAGWVAAF